MMMWWQYGLQNMVSLQGKSLDFLHDLVSLISMFILIIVGIFLMGILKFSWINKQFVENSTLEFLWTCFPVIILSFLGVNSIFSLYFHESEVEPSMTLKVSGHQWYWTYEYTDFSNLAFDSYMLPLNELFIGAFRNLDVDNRAVLPLNTGIRVVVTSADVLHSWALPPVGMKVDANPGKLNSLFMEILFPGLFFGQCSEICGINHSFMPICVEITSTSLFKYWVSSFN